MRGLIQRVSSASVRVEGAPVGEIGVGILLLLGIAGQDGPAEVDKLLRRVLNYRIFPDENNKMNRSLLDISGELLVVSQFTLVADTARGLRPGFSSAAEPTRAEMLYQMFIDSARQQLGKVATGLFAADMQVSLCNDGPVTFLLEV